MCTTDVVTSSLANKNENNRFCDQNKTHGSFSFFISKGVEPSVTVTLMRNTQEAAAHTHQVESTLSLFSQHILLHFLTGYANN